MEKSKNNNELRIWLQTIAIGFGLASIGILIAFILYLITFKK